MEANRLNVSISKGHWDSARKSTVSQMITLEKVIEGIKAHGFDEYTTNGLIEIASRYPANALISFKRNFNVMIRRVRAQRQKEQHGEINNGQSKVEETGGENQESGSGDIRLTERSSRGVDDGNKDAFEEFGEGDGDSSVSNED